MFHYLFIYLFIMQMFGTVHGHRVAVFIDTSDACFGFGRRTQFIQDLTVNLAV